MNKQYATKFSIFAHSVAAVLLKPIYHNVSADTYYEELSDTLYNTSAYMQLARADSPVTPAQHRTVAEAGVIAAFGDSPSKEVIKDRIGVYGHAGKTPNEKDHKEKTKRRKVKPLAYPLMGLTTAAHTCVSQVGLCERLPAQCGKNLACHPSFASKLTNNLRLQRIGNELFPN